MGFAQSAVMEFDTPLTFTEGEFIKVFETGELTGTLTGVQIFGILTESIDLTYANDLTIYVTTDGEVAPGGLLQIGGFGNLEAVERLSWPCGAECDTDEPGTVVSGFVTVTPINFTDNPTYTVWIGNGYLAPNQGTWDSVEVELLGVETEVGIEDQTIAGFSQFYNPQSKNLTIAANENFSSISLFNVLGQQVLSRNLSSNNEVINLSNMKDGVYIANVTAGGNTTTFKIVKR
jgi:hypothetical protein